MAQTPITSDILRAIRQYAQQQELTALSRKTGFVSNSDNIILLKIRPKKCYIINCLLTR